jgi:hypothetical protein
VTRNTRRKPPYPQPGSRFSPTSPTILAKARMDPTTPQPPRPRALQQMGVGVDKGGRSPVPRKSDCIPIPRCFEPYQSVYSDYTPKCLINPKDM